jgi:hypothetical protein
MLNSHGMTRAERAIHEIEAHHITRLESLPAHVSVLDANGAVKLINSSWRTFAASNGGCADAYLGQNYLDVCRKSASSNDHAAFAYNGLRAVLDGDLNEFALDYPCHSPSTQRWFRMEVTLVDLQQRSSVIVSHVNITDINREQTALRHLVEDVRGALAILGFNVGGPRQEAPAKPSGHPYDRSISEILGETVVDAHYLATQMLEFVKREDFTEKEATEFVARLINQWAQSVGARMFNGTRFFTDEAGKGKPN